MKIKNAVLKILSVLVVPYKLFRKVNKYLDGF